MVCKGYRLSTLKMGISRQNSVFIILGNGKNSGKQILYQRNDLVCLVPEIKSDIHGNLIVSASCGVKLLADIADTLCQLGLDEHMNVLCVHIKLKLSAFKIVKDRLKTCKNFVAVVVGDDLLHCKHCRMPHRARDILLIHLAVKVDRRIEVIGFLIQFLGKSACPHFFHSCKFSKSEMRLFQTGLFLHLGHNLGRKSVEVDKSCGIRLVVNLVLVEGCDLGIVE